MAVSIFVGEALTRTLVSDGLERLSGEERVAAARAVSEALLACASEPGDRVLRRKLQVIEVSPISPGYRVLLQAYTIHARPADQVVVALPGGVRCGVQGAAD